MDFKIGDDIEETSESPKKKNNYLSTIIIVVVSLFFGLTVFFISYALFGPKKDKEPEQEINTNLSLNDENVKILYNYVTYGVNDKRNEKFIKEKSVKLENFTNEEKFYYALQFAQVEDFANTGKLTEQNQKIYNISSAKIRSYMQRFFGNEITYKTTDKITYPFSFRINNQNVGTLTYSSERNGFDTVFSADEQIEETPNLVAPYYAELTNAVRKTDGSIELTEKIVFPEVTKKEELYDINVYKDYDKTILIEQKTNLTEENIKEKPISVKDYGSKATTITYLFKLSSTNYYFYSSEINN